MTYVNAIFRYPVKGLSAEPMARVKLEARQSLPGDRALAFARATAPFDPADPKHLPKAHFLMLMRDEVLARLSTRFDPDNGLLTVSEGGVTVMDGVVTETAARVRLETFFQEYLDLPERPRLVSVPGHMFSDRAEKVVSILNLASVRELGRRMEADIDPIRFRANFHIEGLPEWAEFNWPGRRLQIGTAIVEVIDPIRRCAATMVNPATAERDLKIPTFLMENYGHMNMGIYARVVGSGEVATDDKLELVA